MQIVDLCKITLLEFWWGSQWIYKLIWEEMPCWSWIHFFRFMKIDFLPIVHIFFNFSLWYFYILPYMSYIFRSSIYSQVLCCFYAAMNRILFSLLLSYFSLIEFRKTNHFHVDVKFPNPIKQLNRLRKYACVSIR